MKISVTALTFLALAAGAFAAPDNAAIKTAEKNAWPALKEKKFETFQKMLTPEFRGACPDGIIGLGKEMADVRPIEDNVALVTYRVTVKGTKWGRNISGKPVAASTWKREGNTWCLAFHTDMTAP